MGYSGMYGVITDNKPQSIRTAINSNGWNTEGCLKEFAEDTMINFERLKSFMNGEDDALSEIERSKMQFEIQLMLPLGR